MCKINIPRRFMVSKYYGIIPPQPTTVPSCHPPLISFTKHIHPCSDMNCEKASIQMDTVFFFPFSISKLRCKNQPKKIYKINRIYTRKKNPNFPHFLQPKWWYIYDNFFHEFNCTFPIPIKEDFIFFESAQHTLIYPMGDVKRKFSQVYSTWQVVFFMIDIPAQPLSLSPYLHLVGPSWHCHL